jgi:hypothetical protein
MMDIDGSDVLTHLRSDVCSDQHVFATFFESLNGHVTLLLILPTMNRSSLNAWDVQYIRVVTGTRQRQSPIATYIHGCLVKTQNKHTFEQQVLVDVIYIGLFLRKDHDRRGCLLQTLQ